MYHLVFKWFYSHNRWENGASITKWLFQQCKTKVKWYIMANIQGTPWRAGQCRASMKKLGAWTLRKPQKMAATWRHDTVKSKDFRAWAWESAEGSSEGDLWHQEERQLHAARWGVQERLSYFWDTKICEVEPEAKLEHRVQSRNGIYLKSTF